MKYRPTPRPSSTRGLLLTFLLTTALAAASVALADSKGGGSASGEPTATAAADYAKLRERIAALSARANPPQAYALAKASAFFEASYYEHSRNDRGPFPADALAEAGRLVTALEGDQGVSAMPWSTSGLSTKSRAREDLWQRLEAQKTSPKFACAAALIARAEVELVHAASEIETAPWHHGRPQIAVVEELLVRIERVESTNNCAGRN